MGARRPGLAATANVLPSVLPGAVSNVLSTRHSVSAMHKHRFRRSHMRSHMKKYGVYATTTVGAAAVSVAFFGTGIGIPTASADDYSGQTYADASKAISDAGKKAVVASRAGDTLSDDECTV